MIVEYDPDKDAANVAKHGLSLGEYRGFDSDPIIAIDDRHEYGEIRYRAIGLIGDNHYVLVWVMRDTAQRLISFRRARAKELRQYERRGRVGR